MIKIISKYYYLTNNEKRRELKRKRDDYPKSSKIYVVIDIDVL